MVYEWSKGRLNTDELHVVGHSQGGHVAGFVGQSFFQASGRTKKLRRISGLDPFEFAYDLTTNITHIFPILNVNDADFVDIHHTSVNVRSTGTIDIYYNDPQQLQPGCVAGGDSFKCSHMRLFYFWTEMISLEAAPFYARKADSWESFTRDRNLTELIELGPNTELTSRGNYFLQTNPSSPFSRGLLGVHYASNG